MSSCLQQARFDKVLKQLKVKFWGEPETPVAWTRERCDYTFYVQKGRGVTIEQWLITDNPAIAPHRSWGPRKFE